MGSGAKFLLQTEYSNFVSAERAYNPVPKKYVITERNQSLFVALRSPERTCQH
jgi:hypothetical protein